MIKESVISESIGKAKILIEALPYIERFYGKIVVVKYGGAALVDERIKETIMQDIALMKLVGMKPVLVHGGGPEINKYLDIAGIESKFIDGLRVTTAETMEIVEMVLAGKVNKSIVSDLEQHGIKAVGISGKDGNTFYAEKIRKNGVDYGFVGDIKKVDTSLLESLINNDFIPVVSPIGKDNEGNTYNINADYAAVAVAGALNAQKLVFLTDVSGVLKDINDPSSIMSFLKEEEVFRLIDDGTISGGMIPKVECCMAAVKKGVKNVHILDGRIEHSLILEIFTPEGIGTMIEKGE